VDAERDQAADFSAAKNEAERDPLLIRGVCDRAEVRALLV
jgi:hypothetical protein